MTIEERSKNIIHDIKMKQGKNPVKIFEDMISKEYICMHGPEGFYLYAYHDVHSIQYWFYLY